MDTVLVLGRYPYAIGLQTENQCQIRCTVCAVLMSLASLSLLLLDLSKIAVHMSMLAKHRRYLLVVWLCSTPSISKLHIAESFPQQYLVLPLACCSLLPLVLRCTSLVAFRTGRTVSITVSISMISGGQSHSCVCAPARQHPASVHSLTCHVQAVGQAHRSCCRSAYSSNKQVQDCLPMRHVSFAGLQQN